MTIFMIFAEACHESSFVSAHSTRELAEKGIEKLELLDKPWVDRYYIINVELDGA